MHEIAIDYIQASISMQEPSKSNDSYKPCHPVSWYKRAYIDEDGVRYNFGNNRSKKALVIASGEAMQSLRDKYQTDENVCGFLRLTDGNVTRFDIALTKYISDDFFTVSDVQGWYKEGKIKSSWDAMGNKIVSSFDKDGEVLPETFYIGSLEERGDKGIFRAYDKGLQMKIEPYLITRLEIEDRGDKANVSARRFMNGASLESVFMSRFNVEDEIFQDTLKSEPCKTTRGVGREKRENNEMLDKKWSWLLEQVAPALKKAIEDERKRDVNLLRLAEFIQKAGLVDSMLDGAEFIASQAIIDYDSGVAQNIERIRKSRRK